MNARLQLLESNIQAVIGPRLKISVCNGQITAVVNAKDYKEVAYLLRDDATLAFEMALDLAGVDYLNYGDGAYDGPRFAVVTHLLSIKHNWRLRLRVFASDDDFPSLPSIADVWNSLQWYEREAFDLFGIVFDGHTDLRRILTDYGFVGHPFRKDFPVSGFVEMRYDETEKRVIYQPITIEPREIVPRIIREENYGGLKS